MESRIILTKGLNKMNADYIYNRKDGGMTKCYGKILWDSSFFIECNDENDSGHVEDLEGETHNTWRKACVYLEENGFNEVEEISVD